MSTLKLYKSTKLLPDKNYIVDSLADYLNSFTGTNIITISDFQYIKHSLSLSVKINQNQSLLEFSNASNDFNYMSIQNDDETYPVYYFILSKRWKAKETCELVLKMDTLNTFTLARNSFTISPRTLVDREHKNRFGLYGSFASTFDAGFLNTRIVFDHSILRSITGRSRLYYDHTSITFKWFDELLHNFVSSEEHTYVVEHIETQDNQIKIYGYNESDVSTLKEVINYDQIPSTRILVFVTSDSYDSFECTDVEDDIYEFYKYCLAVERRRVIDMNSEGLTPILFARDSGVLLKDKSLPDYSWYLVYKNKDAIQVDDFNQVNPVQCFIVADSKINIAYEGGSNVINVNALQNGYIYYVRKPTWDDSSVTPNDITLEDEDGNTHSTFMSSSSRVALYFYRSANDIIWGYIEASSSDTWACHFNEIGKTKYLIPSSNPLLVGKSDTIFEIWTQAYYEAHTTESNMTLADSSVQIDSINEVDRTSAKMIKIIKLPYCPIPMTYSGGVFSFDRTKFEYASTDELDGIAFKDLSQQDLLKEIQTLTENPLKKLNDIDWDDALEIDLKDEKYESKLLHSDYYQQKVIYDSFNYTFKLELADFNLPIDNLLDFYFKTTTTINSKFLFKFKAVNSYIEEDYPYVMPVARNNELVLYNSQYINYLKTGYNIDVKQKNRQQATSAIMSGISMVGAIASFASSAVTGGVGIAAGIGLATGSVTSIINTANTIAQSEQNLFAKQEMAKNQAVGVSGSDDVDLMSYYTGNRAKLMTYQLSPRMRKAMFDVFYYTGYICGQMKVPDMTSRMWFNFVKCDIIFTSEENIPSECVDDLKELFNTGVTIMHKHNGTWDWNRQYENWETFLFE